MNTPPVAEAPDTTLLIEAHLVPALTGSAPTAVFRSATYEVGDMVTLAVKLCLTDRRPDHIGTYRVWRVEDGQMSWPPLVMATSVSDPIPAGV